MTAQFIVSGMPGCMEKNVKLEAEGMTVKAESKRWSAEYEICESSVEISLACENGIYSLPIVCSKNNTVEISPDEKTITINKKLAIKSDTPLTCDPEARVFHQVGGLLYLPISVPVVNKAKLSIEIY